METGSGFSLIYDAYNSMHSIMPRIFGNWQNFKNMFDAELVTEFI